MIDHEPAFGEKRSFRQFMEREEGYDIAFWEAWDMFDRMKDTPITTAKIWLKLLDTIHKCATHHLPELEKVGSDLDGNALVKKKQGRCDSENWYGLRNDGCLSDEEGIKDIIKKIWIEKEACELVVNVDQDNHYIITKEVFFSLGKGSKIKEILITNEGSSENTIEAIYKKILPIYSQSKTDTECMRMVLTAKPEDRESKALKIFQNYLEQIKKAQAKEEKLKRIAITMRDIMQVHLYFDGNARSVYILANIMCHHNGLKVFYPRNMCMFDGNSVPTMVREITKGQERFASMFGDVKRFSKSFLEYKNAVVGVYKLFQDNQINNKPLEEAVKLSDFNLLLRRTAVDSKHLSLMKLLLQNMAILNIDINSKGANSGSVGDVANKFKNEEGLELLKKYGVK